MCSSRCVKLWEDHKKHCEEYFSIYNLSRIEHDITVIDDKTMNDIRKILERMTKKRKIKFYIL